MDTFTWGRNRTMMTENGVRHRQVKECQGFPRTTRNWERAIEQIPPRPPKGINPADTWISGLTPQEL